MSKSFISCITALSLTIVLPLSAMAQSRDYIRKQISLHGQCRNVAITKYNGDLMLYGRNGWAASGCPSGLTDALDKLNDQEEFIDDVQLTDQGRWLILYGDNGVMWSNIPYSLERKLREYNSDGESITSVTFNDDGDWIVITTEHISSSSSSIQEWMADGMDDYGGVYAACVTDDAIVVVYEDGYRFFGNIPSDLKSNLQKATFDVYRLKIAGESWFYSDGVNKYNYHM